MKIAARRIINLNLFAFFSLVLFAIPNSTPGQVCQGGLDVFGTTLPVAPAGNIFQGGPPNFADTYVTPYAATQAGTITSWKAEFTGGNTPGPVVPIGIQLKVLRQVSINTLQVVSAGQVHDPRPPLQTLFSGYPFFQSIDSVIEFTDPALNVQPGDIIGLTIKSDPLVSLYAYPLVSIDGTRLVLSDVLVGGNIDLGSAFTGSLSQAPALQVNVNSCLFNFSGFFQPVDNLPVVNVVQAGQAIPVKFSLNGNNGLNIFAAGYPVSSQVTCDASEPGALIEETVTAGGSSLSYDATTDRYIYVWKTNKVWKGTCRMLDVRLADGTEHFAKFQFK